MRVRTWIAATLVALATAGGARAQGCDRACLTGVVDSYLAAMLAHDPAKAPLARGVKSTENGQVMPPGDGLWGTISGLGGYKLYFHDVQTGQVGFYGVIEENGAPDILSLRLKVKDRRIVEAETIVARREMTGFSKPLELKDKPLFTQAVAPGRRQTRAQMVGVVKAYLAALLEAKGHPELFHADCTRIENGNITANNPAGDRMGKLTCGEQLETGVSARLSGIREPRFLMVDEERGLVHVVMFFDHTAREQAVTVRYRDGTIEPARARSLNPFSYMCSEVFKLEGGKIRQIEVVLLPVPYRMTSGWPSQ
jgi:hypothetical protein